MTIWFKNSIVRALKSSALGVAPSVVPVTEEIELANTAQSKKRARQAEKRRQHNTGLRSRMRTQVKQVLQAVKGNDKTTAQTAFKMASSAIDRNVNKGLVHKNAAARYKRRLNARIRALG